MFSLLFLAFSVLVANPKKTALHGGQSRSWSAEQGKERTKEKVWQHTPTLFVRRKINKITRRIYRRYAGLGRSRVHTRIPSARRLGQWVFVPENLVSRDRFGSPVPRQPAHLRTQAVSGAYLRDSSRVYNRSTTEYATFCKYYVLHVLLIL